MTSCTGRWTNIWLTYFLSIVKFYQIVAYLQGCKNHIDTATNNSIGRDRKEAYINECVQCWRDKISEDGYRLFPEKTTTKIDKCVDDYASAFLEDSKYAGGRFLTCNIIVCTETILIRRFYPYTLSLLENWS